MATPVTASASLDLTGVAADGYNSYTYNAAITYNYATPYEGDPYLSFPVSASGAITLSASASCSFAYAPTASGSITIAGSGTDSLSFPISASGAITLTASATSPRSPPW